jgi:hypothetical protein
MATAPKRPARNGFAADRKIVELAKTMDIEALTKKTGRKPESILKTAKRLGIKIKMVNA